MLGLEKEVSVTLKLQSWVQILNQLDALVFERLLATDVASLSHKSIEELGDLSAEITLMTDLKKSIQSIDMQGNIGKARALLLEIDLPGYQKALESTQQ